MRLPRLKPDMKYIGMGYSKLIGEYVPIFVEIEPKYEILNGEMVEVASEFMGYSNEGNEVWT